MSTAVTAPPSVQPVQHAPMRTATLAAATRDRRTVVALRSERALMHAGLASVCARYAPWLALATPDAPHPVDVMVFDPSGDPDHDAEVWASLRAREDVGAFAVLVHPDARAHDLVGPRDAAIGLDLTDDQLVRALLQAASRRSRRIVRRRRDGDWFGKAAGLTQRQSQCVALCATGMTNQEIAEDLFINIETVKSHLKLAYQALGVRNRAELIATVLRAQA